MRAPTRRRPGRPSRKSRSDRSRPTEKPADEDRYATRFSVSLPASVARDLDEMVADRGIPSRSQALADVVRNEVVQHRAVLGRGMLAGTITLVYRNTGNNLRTRLTRIQKAYLKEVISSQHVFLEDQHSLEVLLVQGPADTLRRLCNELTACRGVQQARLTLTTALLPPLHGLRQR